MEKTTEEKLLKSVGRTETYSILNNVLVIVGVGLVLALLGPSAPKKPEKAPVIQVKVEGDSLRVLTNAHPDEAAGIILNSLASQSGTLINRAIFVADSVAAENLRLKSLLAEATLSKGDSR